MAPGLIRIEICASPGGDPEQLQNTPTVDNPASATSLNDCVMSEIPFEVQHGSRGETVSKLNWVASMLWQGSVKQRFYEFSGLKRSQIGHFFADACPGHR